VSGVAGVARTRLCVLHVSKEDVDAFNHIHSDEEKDS